MENGTDVVKAVEAEVVDVASKVKADILAQKQDFVNRLEQVKKDMANLQQQWEQKKTLGTKLEGAIESLDILLNKSTSK